MVTTGAVQDRDAARALLRVLHTQGQLNHKRVARLMRRPQIVGVHLPRRRRTTIADRSAAPAPDLFGRDFAAAGPNAKWCGDITYLRVGYSYEKRNTPTTMLALAA